MSLATVISNCLKHTSLLRVATGSGTDVMNQSVSPEREEALGLLKQMFPKTKSISLEDISNPEDTNQWIEKVTNEVLV